MDDQLWPDEEKQCIERNKRRSIIESNRMAGQLRLLIEKSRAVLLNSTENQLIRFRDKIKETISQIIEKNTELMLESPHESKEHEDWILNMIDQSDTAIESIETQIDNLKSKNPPKSTMQTNEAIQASELIKLKKISLPSFSGNKREYSTWRATFKEFVDKTNTSPEYKLLQLKDALTGEAAQSTHGLGYSREAYECALDRLDRKYGGRRRETSLLLEEVSLFKPVRKDYPSDLEKFSDLLETLVLNLTESDRIDELGAGMLYVTLKKNYRCRF